MNAARNDGVENEQVLQGNSAQAAEGLRLYREWRDRRAARIELGSAPSYRTATAEGLTRGAAAQIDVETISLPAIAGRPSGRKFGRLVHDMLQHAGLSENVETLAAIWGQRHGAGDVERAAAVEAVRAALAHPAMAVPEDARRYRELPVVVRLDDGTLFDGRIDFAWSDGERWTVIDYKTDRREKRNVAQVRVYALALQRATGIPVRGIVLEV
ncbi:MAG: PD-(D/E)XK nuclease family protein [Casimicrobiaceae bacterium]